MFASDVGAVHLGVQDRAALAAGAGRRRARRRPRRRTSPCVAAPLLDSSSGWAWTCMSRRPAPGRAAGSGDMVASLGVTMSDVDSSTLTERYGAPSPRGGDGCDRRPGSSCWRAGRARLAGLGDVRARRPRRSSPSWWASTSVDAHQATARFGSTVQRRGRRGRRCTAAGLRRGPHGGRRAVVHARARRPPTVEWTVRTERRATAVDAGRLHRPRARTATRADLRVTPCKVGLTCAFVGPAPWSW